MQLELARGGAPGFQKTPQVRPRGFTTWNYPPDGSPGTLCEACGLPPSGLSRWSLHLLAPDAKQDTLPRPGDQGLLAGPTVPTDGEGDVASTGQGEASQSRKTKSVEGRKRRCAHLLLLLGS